MFIDSSIPNRKGQKARVKSVTITKSSNSVHCLRFAYYMYGDNVGTMNVYLSTGTSVPTIPSYSLTGSKGNQWFRQQLTINFNSNLDFSVNNLNFVFINMNILICLIILNRLYSKVLLVMA